MRQSYKLLTAVAGIALLMSASAGVFARDLANSESLLSNNPDGVDAYTMSAREEYGARERYGILRVEPAGGDVGYGTATANKMPITNVRGPERMLGNNPDGIAGYSAADQKLEWQFLQRNHPSAIEPAGGGHGNVPSQGTYNKFMDDPFGDIEE